MLTTVHGQWLPYWTVQRCNISISTESSPFPGFALVCVSSSQRGAGALQKLDKLDTAGHPPCSELLCCGVFASSLENAYLFFPKCLCPFMLPLAVWKSLDALHVCRCLGTVRLFSSCQSGQGLLKAAHSFCRQWRDHLFSFTMLSAR